jgi:lipopolysaccharide export system protein LptA
MYNSVMYNANKSTAGTDRVKQAMALAMALAFASMVSLVALPVMAQDDEPLRIEADDLLEWDQDAGRYIARGNAVATKGDTNISGDVLVATYDPDAEEREITQITGTGDVTFSDAQGNATGQKIIYNVDGSGYRVDGPASRVKGKNGNIAAERDIVLVTFEDDTQQMTATGDAVYINAENERFAGNVINAFFDKEGALERVEGDGKVNILTAEGSTATGDSVIYLAQTDKATLVGNVTISDGKSTMQGGRAEMDFASGNSRILSDKSGGRVSGVLVTN